MGIFGMFGKKENTAEAQPPKAGAETGENKEVSYDKTLMLQNFTQAMKEGDQAEMLRLAEEGERRGDGSLMKHLAASLIMLETMEDVEKKLNYCDRAEALGEDVSREREMALLDKEGIELAERAAAMPSQEEITMQIQKAQQIAMEMAKAGQQSTD